MSNKRQINYVNEIQNRVQNLYYVDDASELNSIDLRENDKIYAINNNKLFQMEIADQDEELSGSIVSFNGRNNTKIKSVVANIEPVQDLHGYDHPWPAGGGKNLANPQTGYDSSGGNVTSTTIITTTNLAISSLIKVDPSTQYTLSRQTGGGVFRCFYFDTEPVVGETVSIGGQYFNNGVTSVTVTTHEDAAWMFIIWTRDSETTPCGNVQMEKGSTVTAWTPYENICSISGWDGMNIRHANENLIDVTPTEIGGNKRWYKNTGIQLKAGVKYTLKSNTTSGVAVYFRNIDDSNTLENCVITNNGKSKATCIPNIDVLACLRTYAASASAYPDDFILELTIDENAAVVAHKGGIFPISWQNEAGTIYGGTVTLNEDGSVDVVNTMQIVILDGSSTPIGSYNGEIGTSKYFSIPSSGVANPASLNLSIAKCNKAKPFNTSIWSNPDIHIWEFTINANKQLHVVFDNVTVGITSEMDSTQRATVIKTWLTDNPMTFVLPKQEIDWESYHFENIGQLTAFLGINNIWSDIGDITVKIAEKGITAFELKPYN